MRLRADPGRFCVVGLTGRGRRHQDEGVAGQVRAAAAQGASSVMLSLWDHEQGRKIQFSCQAPKPD
jgi:hypothetical protein